MLSLTHGAVTQPTVGFINNSLPTTTSVSDDAVPSGAATNLHDTVELHGAAAQMNILLENHGTSITVIAGLTMTLKVFALMRRLLNVTLVTPLPFL